MELKHRRKLILTISNNIMEVINTLGRRKSSVARIYVSEGTGKITVNKKDYKEYFDTPILHYRLDQPFLLTDLVGKFDINVNVNGGGITGQAEAIRLAISRALCEIDIENRTVLKKEGLMTRDPRMVERKKPGQKKARKKFQFSKR
jgi:small subunit ribosomal protein S9